MFIVSESLSVSLMASADTSSLRVVEVFFDIVSLSYLFAISSSLSNNSDQETIF